MEVCMLEYIKGILVASNPQKVVIEVGNMGYGLSIPLNVYPSLPHVGEQVLLYIARVIREHFHRHFGFLAPEDRDLFQQMNDISGMGPKTALSLLGHLQKEELASAIAHANVSLLSKIPGIGKRTAERLIVEMRGKIAQEGSKIPGRLADGCKNGLSCDAINALTHLGYGMRQAQQAVQHALTSFEVTPSLTNLIRRALKGVN